MKLTHGLAHTTFRPFIGVFSEAGDLGTRSLVDSQYYGFLSLKGCIVFGYLSLKGCIVFIVVVSTYNGSPQLVAHCRGVAQGQWLVASRCFLGDWCGADG